MPASLAGFSLRLGQAHRSTAHYHFRLRIGGLHFGHGQYCFAASSTDSFRRSFPSVVECCVPSFWSTSSCDGGAGKESETPVRPHRLLTAAACDNKLRHG